MNGYGLESFIAQEGFFANRKLNKKYKNPDGSLNAEGKRCYDMYLKKMQLRDKMYAEAEKIVKKNKQLQYDFGGTAYNVDDEDLIDLRLQELNIPDSVSNGFYKAKKEYYQFGDAKSLYIGETLSESMKPAQEGLFEKKDKPPVDAKKAEAFVLKAVKEVIQEVYNTHDKDFTEENGYKSNPNFKAPYKLNYNKEEDDDEIKYLIYPKGKIDDDIKKKEATKLNYMVGSIFNQKYKKETKEFGIKFVKANKDSGCLIVYFKK